MSVALVPSFRRLSTLVPVLFLALAGATLPMAVAPTFVAAQVDAAAFEPDVVYEVRLADGSVLIGRVVVAGSDRVTITTTGGTRVEVDLDQIRSAAPVEGRVVDGEIWHDDSGESHLFFAATGRTMGQGEAHVGTYLIVFPFIAFGLTDRFTVAAGAPVLFGELEPLYFAPKVQLLRTASATVSVGALHVLLPDDDEDVGVAYSVGTFGNDDDALSVGLGWGYAGSDFTSKPVAMIGAERRVSRRSKLLTENYFLPGETGAVFSVGFRFIGERLSADIGVGAATDQGDLECCLPLLSVSYGFGQGR